MAAQDWLDSKLGDHFDVKHVGRIGPGAQTELRFLQRSIRWSAAGFTYQADSKQVDKLIHILDVDTCKSALSPGTKATGQARRDADELLDGTRASEARTGSGLSTYVSVDRPDRQYVTKTVMSSIATPSILTEVRLRRLGRYLVGHRTLEFVYDYQDEHTDITC